MTATDVKLPLEFMQRLEKILPKEKYQQVLNSFGQQLDVGFRVNTLKADVADTIKQLQQQGFEIKQVPWLPYAFTVPAEQRSTLTHSELHEQGYIYVQNLSSMVPVYLLDPQPGERVLDLTAAPGSKTTQIACHMQNQGWISAVEKVKNRFHRLKANLDLQGATIVHTYLKDGATVWRPCAESFDRVLLDAPCSSEARFDPNDEESLAYWSERKVRDMAKKQIKLLFSAIQCLKPGGTLVYSTCSFAPEENEGSLTKALRTFGDALEVESIELPFENFQQGLSQWQKKEFDLQTQNGRRILPNDQMEGFFVCRLRKKRSTIEPR